MGVAWERFIEGLIDLYFLRREEEEEEKHRRKTTHITYERSFSFSSPRRRSGIMGLEVFLNFDSSCLYIIPYTPLYFGSVSE